MKYNIGCIEFPGCKILSFHMGFHLHIRWKHGQSFGSAVRFLFWNTDKKLIYVEVIGNDLKIRFKLCLFQQIPFQLLYGAIHQKIGFIYIKFQAVKDQDVIPGCLPGDPLNIEGVVFEF